ncbi:hypothetical protein ACN9MJ_12835 [Acidovorax facilis]|uniref:hypothetical protein n=1 Tax=Acidovorax facilis TaxID=12917 RepID=UPI003CFAD7C4
MKSDSLVILAAAAAAIYLISSTRRTVVGGTGGRPLPATGWPAAPNTAAGVNGGGSVPVTEVTNTALPGDYGWGWKYYSDGTAISPSGQYYLNGELVWSPAAGQMGMGF